VSGGCHEDHREETAFVEFKLGLHHTCPPHCGHRLMKILESRSRLELSSHDASGFRGV